MSRIRQLRLDGVRNLAAATLDLHPRCTLISGDNGSGKTALLEALYLLGRGKSFRENQTRHLINHDKPHLRLIARIERDGREHLLGIEKSVREHRLRLDGENLKTLSDLAALTPNQILNSDNFALIDQGPEHRRRYLDYGLYYHNPAFLPDWQRYNYALKNRNAALRQNWRAADLAPWNHILGETGSRIDAYRRAYLAALEQALNTYHAELGGLDPIHIHYQRGWAGDDLAAQLTANNERDSQLKHTRDGIHRADIRFHANGRDIAHHYSRGQQKTLICALILAQTRLITADNGSHPIILIDDIAAELDRRRQHMLLNFLADSGAQLYITHIDGDDLPLPDALADHQHLHIDAGRITEKQ